MRLGLYTDSVANLGLEETLDLTVEIGAEALEMTPDAWSSAPHLSTEALLQDGAARRRFMAALADRGLELAALNCSAWLLHPRHGEASAELFATTAELAEALEVDTLVAMSGQPGDSPDDQTVNWAFYPHPQDAVELQERQWQQAEELWHGLADTAARHGVNRIALELHPVQLAYNVPTLLRLREAIGEIIGANIDPSHLFWQQMDAVEVVKALGDAVFHVHLKDTSFSREQLALVGVLDSRDLDADARAWSFRCLGDGHGPEFWSPFLASLAEVGYQGLLSIENEDPEYLNESGVRRSAAFIDSLR